jgi:hypothetical protein
MQHFVPLPVSGLQDAELARVMRLNCLGSLFYFIRHGLRRHRLTEGLHLPFCRTMEREHIKDVIEMPRDHFKSTCASEGLPMWRTLPLTQQDLDQFYALGYNDEFIRWMKWSHNPNLRNILVAENITNAAKLGRKIRFHYESNGAYRTMFPETLPDTSCTWTDYSLHVKRGGGSMGGAHGEGTFDFMGVGSALQSRHYNGLCIQDDLVGRKAVESQSIMDKTIEYHQLLANATESEDNTYECDELVVGNRWSYADLNSHLREHEPEFRFESHSALGGCCELHPPDTPIFPEEFSAEKLAKRRSRLGAFNFSCQFLNNPSAPENADFRLEWLNYFRVAYDPAGNGRWKIIHEVKDGAVLHDINRASMSIGMAVDPNHSGNTALGRCRHAIVVLGVSDEGNYYLLESWAQAASYDKFYNMIFELARKWGLHRIGVETIAAQRYIKHHIESMSLSNGYRLTIDELKGEVEAPDGTTSRKKEWRIRNVVAPIAERGNLWIQRRQVDFANEYQTFPKGKYVDQLDAFAYCPQLVHKPVDEATRYAMLQAYNERMQQVGKPYSYGYGKYHS